ncbi:MAG: YggS family pyridoxal phosphate-dependent enzyme [bacterium]|jgi:pyridoxal phosphate enzyme (YggS family)
MSSALENRYEGIVRRMNSACGRAGRDPASVQLLAVSKTQHPDDIAAVAALGIETFGENRVQEARGKIPLCPSRIHWHLIGHLQSNKAREAVHLFEMIHSVDSLRMLETLDRCAADDGRSLPVCLEVNVSGERSKFGMSPVQVEETLEAANRLFRVKIVGLMTIPPIAENPEKARPFFCALRELRNRMQTVTGLNLPELSMGMSHDFEVAIEEGATWIRVGTLLFGPRKRKELDESGND